MDNLQADHPPRIGWDRGPCGSRPRWLRPAAEGRSRVDQLAARGVTGMFIVTACGTWRVGANQSAQHVRRYALLRTKK